MSELMPWAIGILAVVALPGAGWVLRGFRSDAIAMADARRQIRTLECELTTAKADLALMSRERDPTKPGRPGNVKR